MMAEELIVQLEQDKKKLFQESSALLELKKSLSEAEREYEGSKTYKDGRLLYSDIRKERRIDEIKLNIKKLLEEEKAEQEKLTIINDNVHPIEGIETLTAKNNKANILENENHNPYFGEKIDSAGSSRIDTFKLSYIEDYEEEEAKKFVEECLGFEAPRPVGWQMAVKVYVRPEETKEITRPDGSKCRLYMPDSVRAHDKFMSCVGLIIAQGPNCYTGEYYEEPYYKKIFRKFFGRWMEPNKMVPWCKVGDWVLFDRNAGPQVNYRGLPVTIIEDKHIRLVVPDPSYVSRY